MDRPWKEGTHFRSRSKSATRKPQLILGVWTKSIRLLLSLSSLGCKEKLVKVYLVTQSRFSVCNLTCTQSEFTLGCWHISKNTLVWKCGDRQKQRWLIFHWQSPGEVKIALEKGSPTLSHLLNVAEGPSSYHKQKAVSFSCLGGSFLNRPQA